MNKLSTIDLQSFIGKDNIAIKFLLKSKEMKIAKNNSQYLDIVVLDNQCQESIKFWNFSKANFEALEVGKVYGAVVQVTSFNNTPSLIGKEIKVLPNEKASEYANILTNQEEYSKKLSSLIGQIQDKFVEALVNRCFAIIDYNKFYNGIGGLTQHHTEIGGLLRHTVGVTTTALAISSIYKNTYGYLDTDIVLAGCLLHDIGKISEYIVDLNNFTTSYNNKSLMGHIQTGINILSMAYSKIKSDFEDYNYTDEKFKLISHIIASHHKFKEWGSIEEPKTLEAEIVFISDYTDSRFDMYDKVLRKLSVGEYDNKFDVYKHCNQDTI